MIRKSVLLLLALGMLFVFPQAAGAAQTSATTETYDIPATMDWRKGNQSSVACYAFGLATWPEQKNAISWQVTYKWNGDPRSKTTSPPFDDERLNTAQFGNATPPAGSHWIVISEGYKAGLPGFPTPDCSDSLAFQQGAIGDVKVTVTVEAEEKDKCRAITDRDRRLERRVHNAREGKRRQKKKTVAAKKRLNKVVFGIPEIKESGTAKELARAKRERRVRERAYLKERQELAIARQLLQSRTQLYDTDGALRDLIRNQRELGDARLTLGQLRDVPTRKQNRAKIRELRQVIKELEQEGSLLLKLIEMSCSLDE